MIEELRKNIQTELGMLREISTYEGKLGYADKNEAKLLKGAIKALISGIKILNDSIPNILKEAGSANPLPSYAPKTETTGTLERVTFRRADGEMKVVLKVQDKEKFLKELNIGEQFIKKLKGRSTEEKEKYVEFKSSRGYLKLANKIFLRSARRQVKKGRFKELAEGLRRANIDILFESYVAMMFFSVFLSVIVGVFITLFLFFFESLPVWPFFHLRSSGYLIALSKIFWIPLVIPILTFFSIYFYPSTEKRSISSKIDQELPFAVIHMSAVSGSGIAPAEIFKIIGLSREYPNLRKEVRKVLNQINLYGYDLTTALNNAAKTAPSENLSELFSGLSTSITSGANLTEFFEKRAETLLFEYRLEREKYTKLVETFLDIYISVVIAAPMILLLLLVMMAISGISSGLGPFQLSVLSVSVISILNMIFLIFLHAKQPTY
jgi:pilus assembly protein TadC